MTLQALDIVTEYTRRGWDVIPVKYRDKFPSEDGVYPKKRWDTWKPDLPRFYSNGRLFNIGVRLGDRSEGGLVDIDLDCLEAVKLAPRILPATNSVFGRRGKPRSHYLYVVDDPWRCKHFGKIEWRGTGGQTVMPGSVHESGEPIEWETDGERLHIDRATLEPMVRKLAAAALIAQHWPGVGARQDAALALAGALVRSGRFDDDDAVIAFVDAVTWAAGDEEHGKRRDAAARTVAKARADAKLTGWPTLAGVLANGRDVVANVREFLGRRRYPTRS